MAKYWWCVLSTVWLFIKCLWMQFHHEGKTFSIAIIFKLLVIVTLVRGWFKKLLTFGHLTILRIIRSNIPCSSNKTLMQSSSTNYCVVCITLSECSILNTFFRIKCDMCMSVAQAQYHLTMSDATIRNFCTYPCVMNFQQQYSKVPITLPAGEGPPIPTGK